MKKTLSILLTLSIVFGLFIAFSSIVYADQLNEGIYNFECVAGGRYLNVYAGYDWDGANVCVWEKDGSPEQNFKMVDRGGNRYVLYPQSSNGRVLDANRGNSYNNPLQAGNNIDIWQTNDAPAQEWYIDDRGNGKYTIELVSARGLVVSCDNPNSNGGNCSLQTYNGSENQLWYLKRADGGEVKPATPQPATPKPETTRTGYVANTGGIVLRVRAQANTNCAVLGTINEGTAITVKGNDKINGFWKVDFNGSTGYCHGDYISFNKPSSQTLSNIRTTAPSKNNSFYYSNGNIHYPNLVNWEIKGNCVWYAWGRAWEITGKKPANYIFNGNAHTWWERNNGIYASGSTPKVGAIAVWKSSLPGSGGCGHVAVVEKIENGKIYISESIYPNLTFRYKEIYSTNHLYGYIYIK